MSSRRFPVICCYIPNPTPNLKIWVGVTPGLGAAWCSPQFPLGTPHTFLVRWQQVLEASSSCAWSRAGHPAPPATLQPV